MFRRDIADTVTILIMVTMDTAMVTGRRINKTAGLPAEYIRLSDRVIEILLITLLAFMPLAFGAVHDLSQEIVVVISAAVFFIFLVRQIFSAEGFLFTWAYVPVAAFTLLAIFTIIPMPQKTISVFSPQTVSLKNELLSENTEAANQKENFTLSFYPRGTKDNLRIILSVGAVFVVVLNVFKSAEQIKRLLKAIVIIGTAAALLAIAQNVAGNGKIYWFVSVPSKAVSGPFVNHSHFGQFMNMSIGAILSLALLILHREFDKREITVATVFDYFDSSRARALWLLVAAAGISAAAVFASLTRGGMLSMLVAMSVTVLLLSARKSLRQHGWIVVIIALAALVCVLYTGFDTVYERLATLSSLDGYQTRLEVLKDMTEPVRRFIFFGTGLGSHTVIYPMFQSIYTALQFRYAENEYAQLLEETGLAGFIIMLIFAFIVVVNFIRAVRNKEDSISVAVYGLGFGLMAVLIHSVTDFGQHLPANAMLSAIFCGLIITLGRRSKGEQTAYAVRPPKPALLILSAVLACLYGWVLIDADKARIAEGWWREAHKIENKSKTSNEISDNRDFEKLISYAAKAVQAQPDNIEYRYWLGVWKWQNAAGKTDSETGGLTNKAIGEVYGIVDELKKARAVCPTFGPVYCLLGQLQKFVLLEPAGEDNIKKGFMLEPNDEITLFAAGCLDISAGETERSFEKFSKSVGLGGTFFRDIVRIYIEQEKRADLAVEVAADDTKRLKYVADMLSQNSDFAGEAEKARSKLVAMAEQKASKNTADIGELILLGDYYRKNNNSQKAAEYLGAAVAADYGNADLRLKFAQALAESGQANEAVKQLRICLKLKPKYRQAEKLLAELSVKPEVMKQNVSGIEKNGSTELTIK
ncbi:MAG: O-antigen ligase family protein [Phycisphaerae bacterium]|nr:O-antigen ligase family protein [Phycisphaerae bacterium]